MKTIAHKIHVVGLLWQGDELEHTYSLLPFSWTGSQRPADKPCPQTLAEAKRLAGDFQSLSCAEVETTETEFSCVELPDGREQRTTVETISRKELK